jgi:DNA-directed RNA polymerase specialized sigma24 family protein
MPPSPQAAPDTTPSFLSWVSRLVHQHRRRLAGVARREGLGAEDAFDAAQEAFQTFLTLPAAWSTPVTIRASCWSR